MRLRLLTWCAVLLLAAGCDYRSTEADADGGGRARRDARVHDADGVEPPGDGGDAAQDAAEPIADAAPDARDAASPTSDADSEDAGEPAPDDDHDNEPSLPPIPDDPMQPVVDLPPPSAGACTFEPPPPSLPSNAACPDGIYRGDVVLKTADDLRKLYGCWRVAGNLTVELAPHLSDADGLQSLRVIEGALTVYGHVCDEGGCRYGNEHLSSLKGFENLRCVGGDLRIEQGDYDFRDPIDLSALRDLVEVGGSFYVALYSNDKTNTFDSLQRVWGDVEHRSHFSPPRLESVYGGWKSNFADGPIPSGVYVGCSAGQAPCRDGVLGCALEVSSQAQLATLNKCELALRYLRLASPEISDLTPLSKLHTVRGEFWISAEWTTYEPGPLQHLTGLEALKRVGALAIARQPALIDLHALSNLVETASIQLDGLNALKDLTGLDKIARTKALHLRGNAGLETLNGLKLAGRIETLSIVGSSKLKSLAELADVTGPVGYLTLAMLPALENLAGLSKIQAVDQVVTIQGCDSLTDITGLGLSRVNGIGIESNAKLTSLQGLLAPTVTQAGSLSLQANPKLTSLAGVGSLEKLSTLSVTECNALDDLSGLASLREVNYKLLLHSNATLQSLDGVPELRKAPDIELYANPLLANIDGLAQLDQTRIVLKDLPALASLEALSNVSLGVTLWIEKLPALTSLNGLEHISPNLFELQLLDNALLSDISALAALRSISWRLGVSDNPSLATLHGLEGLTSVSEMQVVGNAELAQLRGLSGLTTSTSTIAFVNNPKLPQCEVEWLDARMTSGDAFGSSNDPSGTCSP